MKTKLPVIKRYIVTLEVDAFAEPKTVKHDINYALNMAIVDREFYELHITRALRINVQKKK